MSRRRRGQPVHGWLNLDKPAGISSARAVAVAQRVFDAAKAGHGGTLDPLASGVLPVAFGEATKTAQWTMLGRKRYRFRLRFGEARTTDDAEGEVCGRSSERPHTAAIEAALGRFVGEIDQTPPAFSAIKVDGKRAYARARAGEAVEMAPRRVAIHALRLIAHPEPDIADLEVECGKGTYIRSLARDLAMALGSVGHVAALRRTACGPFVEADAIPLAELEAIGHNPALLGRLMPVATALDDIPALAVTDAQAERLRQGRGLPVSELAHPTSLLPEGSPVRAMAGDRPVAIARIEGGTLRSSRVFNL